MSFDEFCEEFNLDSELLDELWLMDVLAALKRKYPDKYVALDIIRSYYENANEIEESIKQSILKELE